MICLNMLEKRGNLEKIKTPENVRQIIHRLTENGFEAYAVGGCVRDALLGRKPQDWDITTSAKPEEVKALFRRTIDTGIEHGTVTIMMDKEGYEVTTYRLDGEYEDHRHPKEVLFTPSLIEDLKRRDFTINAMAYNDETGIVDKFDGRGDMEKKQIRAVGDAVCRFDEDALRMLRAVRFAGQLGFEIEEKTLDGIREKAPTLTHVSAERIRTELAKLLCSKGPEELFVAKETGLTRIFMPEFDRMCETKQNNPHHCMDVAHHSMKVVQNVRSIYEREGFEREKDFVILVFAALLHDVAKPLCKTTDEDGVDHFYNHGEKGAEMAKKILHRLRFDNETIGTVTKMVRWHDDRYQGGRRGMRRAMNRIGVDVMPYLFALQEADLSAQSEYMREEKMAELAAAKLLYEEVLQAGEAVTVKDLAVSGKDLIEAGVKQGPAIGECLNRLLDNVMEHPEWNEKEILLRMLK